MKKQRKPIIDTRALRALAPATLAGVRGGGVSTSPTITTIVPCITNIVPCITVQPCVAVITRTP